MALTALGLAGAVDIAHAACGREERDLSTARSLLSMAHFERGERLRTVTEAQDLEARGPDAGYDPPDWLLADSRAAVARADAEIRRSEADVAAAEAALADCRHREWRRNGSPVSGGPVAGYPPRGEPGYRPLRDDMIGDFTPGGASRPYRSERRRGGRGDLGDDPRDLRRWRDGGSDRGDRRRDRADSRADRRRDAREGRRDRGADESRRGRRRGSGRDHRAPDDVFYDPPQR